MLQPGIFPNGSDGFVFWVAKNDSNQNNPYKIYGVDTNLNSPMRMVRVELPVSSTTPEAIACSSKRMVVTAQQDFGPLYGLYAFSSPTVDSFAGGEWVKVTSAHVSLLKRAGDLGILRSFDVDDNYRIWRVDSNNKLYVADCHPNSDGTFNAASVGANSWTQVNLSNDVDVDGSLVGVAAAGDGILLLEYESGSGDNISNKVYFVPEVNGATINSAVLIRENSSAPALSASGDLIVTDSRNTGNAGLPYRLVFGALRFAVLLASDLSTSRYNDLFSIGSQMRFESFSIAQLSEIDLKCCGRGVFFSGRLFVNGDVWLKEGSIFISHDDVVFASKAVVKATGRVDLNGKALLLDGDISIGPAGQDIDCDSQLLDWNNAGGDCSTVGSNSVVWDAEDFCHTLEFTSDAILDGRGHSLTIESGAALEVDENVTLELRNITVYLPAMSWFGGEGTLPYGRESIILGDGATLKLNNVTFVIGRPFALFKGRFSVIGDLTIRSYSETPMPFGCDFAGACDEIDCSSPDSYQYCEMSGNFPVFTVCCDGRLTVEDGGFMRIERSVRLRIQPQASDMVTVNSGGMLLFDNSVLHVPASDNSDNSDNSPSVLKNDGVVLINGFVVVDNLVCQAQGSGDSCEINTHSNQGVSLTQGGGKVYVLPDSMLLVNGYFSV